MVYGRGDVACCGRRVWGCVMGDRYGRGSGRGGVRLPPSEFDLSAQQAITLDDLGIRVAGAYLSDLRDEVTLLLAERGVAVIRGVVQVPEAYITIERLMARAYNSKTINAVRGFSSGHYLGGANDNYVFSTDANARVFEMWDFSGCL